MTKNNIFFILVTIYMTVTLALVASANDIYITQVGDTLDLDITQDGQNNEFGDSTTNVSLNGASMTFAITQTGNNNDIAAVINGANYTGTWTFTGSGNTVDLLCSSAAAGNCESVTLNITTVGDDNTFDFDIGDVTQSGIYDNTVSATFTGDNQDVDITQSD